MRGGLKSVPPSGPLSADKISWDGIYASTSKIALLLYVIIETLELFLRRVSFSMLATNYETADVRFVHLLDPLESYDDIDPLLSSIRI
jgi:hypothetical protein